MKRLFWTPYLKEGSSFVLIACLRSRYAEEHPFIFLKVPHLAQRSEQRQALGANLTPLHQPAIVFPPVSQASIHLPLLAR